MNLHRIRDSRLRRNQEQRLQIATAPMPTLKEEEVEEKPEQKPQMLWKSKQEIVQGLIKSINILNWKRKIKLGKNFNQSSRILRKLERETGDFEAMAEAAGGIINKLFVIAQRPQREKLNRKMLRTLEAAFVVVVQMYRAAISLPRYLPQSWRAMGLASVIFFRFGTGMEMLLNKSLQADWKRKLFYNMPRDPPQPPGRFARMLGRGKKPIDWNKHAMAYVEPNGVHKHKVLNSCLYRRYSKRIDIKYQYIELWNTICCVGRHAVYPANQGLHSLGLSLKEFTINVTGERDQYQQSAVHKRENVEAPDERVPDIDMVELCSTFASFMVDYYKEDKKKLKFLRVRGKFAYNDPFEEQWEAYEGHLKGEEEKWRLACPINWDRNEFYNPEQYDRVKIWVETGAADEEWKMILAESNIDLKDIIENTASARYLALEKALCSYRHVKKI